MSPVRPHGVISVSLIILFCYRPCTPQSNTRATLHQRSLCAAPSQSLWPRQRQSQPVTAANRKTSLLLPTWDAKQYLTCSPHARCHTQTIKLSFVGLRLRPSILKYVTISRLFRYHQQVVSLLHPFKFLSFAWAVPQIITVWRGYFVITCFLDRICCSLT